MMRSASGRGKPAKLSCAVRRGQELRASTKEHRNTNLNRIADKTIAHKRRRLANVFRPLFGWQRFVEESIEELVAARNNRTRVRKHQSAVGLCDDGTLNRKKRRLAPRHHATFASAGAHRHANSLCKEYVYAEIPYVVVLVTIGARQSASAYVALENAIVGVAELFESSCSTQTCAKSATVGWLGVVDKKKANKRQTCDSTAENDDSRLEPSRRSVSQIDNIRQCA